MSVQILEMVKKLNLKLQAVERQIARSKIGRIISRPFRYLIGQGVRRIGFPLFGWSRMKKISTIYSDSFFVELPAGLDIYLWGCKTHDSELRLTKYLIQHLKPGDVFIDVGAHFGFYSGLASTLVGHKGKIFAFEPTPKTFKVLKQNTKSSNSFIFNQAIGSKDGSITFYEHDQLHSEYNSTIQVSGLSSNEYIVDISRLDTFAERQNITPNIIKVDVEGAEYEVVKGLDGLYNQAKFHIVLEMFSKPEKNEQQLAAAKQLHSFGLEPYQIDQNGQLEKIKHLEAYLSDLEIESDNIVFKAS